MGACNRGNDDEGEEQGLNDSAKPNLRKKKKLEKHCNGNYRTNSR